MLATAVATHLHAAPVSIAVRPQLRRRVDTLADHLTPCAIRTFDAKEHLCREGDAVTHVYRIEVGHVCLYRMLADGRRQVVNFAYPGDFIGLGAIGEHQASALATSRTSVRCLPIAALRDLVRTDAAVGLKLYEAVSEELLAARELLFTVSRRTAGERVAGFLLALSRRNQRRGARADEIVLPMTRNDIADFLGLTIETVSRTFTKFRNDGLIDLAQCILVTITDPDGLSAAAGEAVDEKHER